MLVEDDAVDAMTVRRALKELDVKIPLACVENGEQALEYLRQSGQVLPCIILLDLNMPVMGGIEFLQVVKHDAVLKRIPVVVLTTSNEQEDKVASFDLGVAGYIRKPIDYRQFVDAVRAIDTYWSISELPQ
jgi:CheY-like chemotaxis protein